MRLVLHTSLIQIDEPRLADEPRLSWQVLPQIEKEGNLPSSVKIKLMKATEGNSPEIGQSRIGAAAGRGGVEEPEAGPFPFR
jgi:hypothetical protein